MKTKSFMMPKPSLLAVFLLFSHYGYSQVEFYKEFPSKGKIEMFDNVQFGLIYYAGQEVNTYKDRSIIRQSGIKELRVNPVWSSFAVIHGNNLDIYSSIVREKRLFKVRDKREIKNKPSPLTTAYSPDARHFLAGYSNGEIIVYDVKTYLPEFILQEEAPVTRLQMSPNNYFIATIIGRQVNIWNFETKAIRSKLTLEAEANDMAFSCDGSLFAVTLDDGLVIYNTRNWEIFYSGKMQGSITSPSFNRTDKYLIFQRNGNELVIFNVRKKEILQTIREDAGPIYACRFIDDATGEECVISNRLQSIVFWNAKGLNPFFGKILNQEVDEKMNEWVKMMQGESMEDYKIRVNEETRAQQLEAFRQEVATNLAGDRITFENPFVGEYKEGENLLTINFTSLPPIEIPVSPSEYDDFKDNDKLKYSNAVYKLTDEDEFVLAYLEVTNEVNNKVYIYDNIGRTRLETIETDLNFVPLETLQLANEEEVRLEEMKEQVITENKQEKLISDNTTIDVKTEVIPDVDADGNKILNYQIGYQYKVINKDFSEKEDFPLGSYDITRSNAAMSLMKIIKKSFEEGDFAKYLSEGKRVKVSITGTADGAPIRGKIPYDERYGKFEEEPYYQNGALKGITITKSSGITSNEQLAFIRAASVQNYLSKNINTLQNTRNDYSYNIEVSEERGGEFRKISIRFTIIDVFKQ